jgi:uncharacterized protein (DUF1697 family)
MRYIAFLRAINVGGHNVKMDQLRSLFESMSFKNVETFIASGNVIFKTDFTEINDLQVKIERQLHNALGYEVSTFIRTDKQIAEIAQYRPFSENKMKQAMAFNIGFLKTRLNEEQVTAIKGFETDIDDLHISGNELYWICKTRQSESAIDAKKLERAIAMPITLRTIKTIYRLTKKYPLNS